MTYADARAILENCRHDSRPCEVSLGKGQTVHVCNECWNRHVNARKAARKAELSQWKDQERSRALEQLDLAGIRIGDRVVWHPSALGALVAGARPIFGRIVERAGYVRIDCGRKVATVDGFARFIPWQAGWSKA